MSSRKKTLNREVFEGSDAIGLRLRAAKKPAVIPFLEIPPEEIDIEPITIDPVDLTEAEPISISPLIVPMDEILPFDDEDDEEAADNSSHTDAKKVSPEKPTARSTKKLPKDSLSLFGVGEIETKAKNPRRS